MDKKPQKKIERKNEYLLKFIGVGYIIMGKYSETLHLESGISIANIVLSNCDSSGVFDVLKHFPGTIEYFPGQKSLSGRVNVVTYATFNLEGSHKYVMVCPCYKNPDYTEYITERITYEEFLRLGSPKELVKKERISIRIKK